MATTSSGLKMESVSLALSIALVVNFLAYLSTISPACLVNKVSVFLMKVIASRGAKLLLTPPKFHLRIRQSQYVFDVWLVTA